MQNTSPLVLLSLLVAFCPVSALAQSAGASHPLLEKKYYIGAGAYLPDKNFKIRVAGSGAVRQVTRTVDFEEAFKTDKGETTGAAEFRWKFGEKWSVAAQYWTTSDSGTAVLTEDIEWEDVVFEEGTFAGAGVGLDVGRLFLGRVFSSGARHEFGAGAGLHWLEIDAYIEGQIKTDRGETELYRGAVSAGAPLPNIGAWYTWSWSPNWAIVTRLDWLSASFREYSGSLWNASAGINWAPFEHFGFTAAWHYFKLNVDVDKSDWQGSAEISQNGPFVAVTAYW
jgi:hypothetical protein